MTQTNNLEEQLRKRLEEHGYKLHKITHFKNYDRIHFGNNQIRISINLTGELSKLAFETIVKACIGKEDVGLKEKP